MTPEPGAPLSAAVRNVMRANRRRDTTPELRLRSALHRSGRRFRVDYAVAGVGRAVRVDIAFTRARLAVFVDGCFWHRRPDHGTAPRHNAGYWAEKLRRNVARDEAVTAALTEAGWTVVRIWEHESLDEAVAAVVVGLDLPAARAEATGPVCRSVPL